MRRYRIRSLANGALTVEVNAPEVSRSPKILSTAGNGRFPNLGRPLRKHPHEISALLNVIKCQKHKSALKERDKN